MRDGSVLWQGGGQCRGRDHNEGREDNVEEGDPGAK